ncbi:hypothetical protein CEXT_541831 [Caerostris extrusa]|uniref:LAGLIDADG homing endonuclease n=1 Tax=Caerostris extrusa TaxID=172846 RepID=A0AAV4U1X6_CAEEX|nr:hypothetical protein CEXT_541831 [Caerostris extrusa]
MALFLPLSENEWLNLGGQTSKDVADIVATFCLPEETTIFLLEHSKKNVSRLQGYGIFLAREKDSFAYKVAFGSIKMVPQSRTLIRELIIPETN